ncbi:hypothetical protein ACIBBD_08390 [Streptomyces sp. NPDC051315]|uniref:hypothetical protein n=1 Tax=Streptomyces sp. NPDC051315 TaxID=3365650 RepID=UPI0037A9890A
MTSDTTHRRSEGSGEPGEEPGKRARVEVRIVSEDPEAARLVADALRHLFAGGEQRSYPADPSGTGTRLHLTLDCSKDSDPLRSWLDASRPPADRTHPDEIS